MNEIISKIKKNGYTIDEKSCTITSNTHLSDIIKNGDSTCVSILEVYKNIVPNDLFEHFQIDDIFISRNLINFFGNTNCDFLINLFNLDYLVSFYHVSDNQKEFYIIQRNHYINIYKRIAKDFNYLKEDTDGYIIYGEKGKSKIRLSKFIGMLTIDEWRVTNIHSSYINYERLINIYKSFFNVNDYSLALLEGYDIQHGYDTLFYDRSNSTNTVLFNSCMNDQFSKLMIYMNNPSKINLLVLINNKSGKITSRSLIWYLGDKIMMDRVYYNSEHIPSLYSNISNILDSYNYTKKLNKLKIRLKSNNIKQFPYLDSFRWKSLITGKFYNKRPKLLYKSFDCTNGSFDTHLF